MAALLKLKGVGRKYDVKTALHKIDLDIKRGEIFSIIGPNGAGKTTLLRTMALLDNPSGGEIFYMGRKVSRANALAFRKKVTMVFQQPVMFNTTVFENVAYGLKIREVADEQVNQKVATALELVGMEGFSERRGKKLSGGEQQRVVLARALVLEPELLLLDEPTANLDPANVPLVEKIITGLKGKTTVVVATHNLFQAKRISDRVACLLEGELIDIGKTEEVFKHPKDERTKKFIRGEFF
ncbi:MAG: ATP-binding cassette domain-containing protein [Candidatus Hadarchaeota archaeon]